MKSDVLLIGVFMSFCPVRTVTGVVGGDLIFSIRAALSLPLFFLTGILQSLWAKELTGMIVKKALFLMSHFGVVHLWVCSGDILSGQRYTS